MRRFTVAELDERCRDQCDVWKNSSGDYSEGVSSMPSGTLMRFIETANTYVHNMFVSSDEDWRLNSTTTVLTSSVGTYPLPDDYLAMRAVEVSADSGGASPVRWEPLDRSTIHGTGDRSYGRYDFAVSPGRPSTYRTFGESIELLPTPDATYSLRMRYVPCAQRLTSSLDVVEGYSGYEQLVVLEACALGLKSQEQHDWAAVLREDFKVFYEQLAAMTVNRDRASPRVNTPRRYARRHRGRR